LIHDENNRNIFFAHSFFILNLSGSLKDVIDSFLLGLLLVLDADLVNVVAEFTLPYLLFLIVILLANYPAFSFDIFNNTINIENGITINTSDRVSCGYLSVVFQGFEFDLEDIGVNLLLEDSCLSL